MIIRKVKVTEYEYQAPINYVAGATEPDIQFQLTDYEIPSGATGRVYVGRSDGTFEYTVATISGNNVTVAPTSSMFSVKGPGAIQVTLYVGNEVVKNFAVPVYVHADLANDSAEAGSDVTGVFRAAEEEALADFQEQAEEIAEEVKESIPEDYTELTEEVEQLNERLDGEIADVKEDLSDIWEEIGGQANVSGNMVHLEDMQDGQEADRIVIKVLPIQAGTGVPSASNVRTISGRSSVTITRLKKNILTFFIDGYVPSISSGKLVQAGGARSDYIPANELTKYTITLERTSGTTTEIYAFYYDKDKTFLSYDQQSTSEQTTNTLTFSTPAKTAFIMCRLGSGNNISTFVSGQMEFGNEATEYEAYSATQYTIDLSNYAPIYGATIDVTNGTLTITHGYIASYAGESIGSPWISSKDVYSEGALPSTGAQVVYPLSTPIEYSITPQSITFSDGINNINSNSGETSVGICSPKEGSIAEKVANLEKDKIDKQQEATNAGKVLAVGSDGVVVPIDPSSFGLSNDIKVALLNCFQNVLWMNDPEGASYNALRNALYGGEEYPRIAVTYNPSQDFTLYIGDNVNILKNFLTVRLYTSASESTIISNYELTGTISEQSNAIIASYEGLTDSFIATAIPWTFDGSYVIGNFYLPGTEINYVASQTDRLVLNTIVKRLPPGTYIITSTNSDYLYGAQIVRTANPKLFSVSQDIQTEGTSKTLWTGTMSKLWNLPGFPYSPQTGSATFTITDPECFWTLNVKRSDNGTMSASDKQAVSTSFTVTRV